MASIRIPSTTLLRAFFQPSACSRCQVRSASGYMPNSKYHKPNALDKLHRRQKKAIRQEKQASFQRAQELTITPPASFQESSISGGEGLPFVISRTTTQNIPVYETSKNGGNKHITQIRRLSGDLDALAKDLSKALSLSETYTDVLGRKKENITINRLTKHVIVRGWRGAEVKKWAEALGF